MGFVFKVYIVISAMHVRDVFCVQTRFSTTTEYRYTYLNDYGIPSNGSTFITFQVQAPSDAHIALKSPVKGEPIEIVIGGFFNTLSCIRLIPQGICSVTALGAVLDRGEYHLFTVYWGDGQILVKKGDTTAAKSNIILSLPLNYNLDDVKVGISTGFGFSGNWVFEDIPAGVTSAPNVVTPITSYSIGTIVASVGVVLIVGMVIDLLLSLKFCKKKNQLANYETNTNFESERQHGLDQISEHHYDSISVPATHTNLDL